MEIIIPIENLTLRQFLKHADQYISLVEDLVNLPCPDRIRIGLNYYPVPQNVDHLTESICYGQRIYLAEKTENDITAILHIIVGYYYPQIFKGGWTVDKASKVLSKILGCNVVELFPAAYQILKLTGDLIERERRLLNRKVKPEEIQAGIDNLNKYADLSAIDFLRESKRLNSDNEIMLLPYSECLVRFMKAKEEQEFAERLREIYENKAKTK